MFFLFYVYDCIVCFEFYLVFGGFVVKEEVLKEILYYCWYCVDCCFWYGCERDE